MVWLGIHLGNWSCHVAYSEGHRTTVFPTYRFEVKTNISQIKCLLGRKLSDPELQLELDYVPFRVIEGPSGYPLIHGRCKGEDRAFTPVEILAMLISSPQFLGRQEYSDSSPPCIGIPMYFTNQQKNDMLRAVKIAGFPSSFCLDETTAIVELLIPTFNVEDPQTINAAFVDIGHASMQVCFGELKRDRLTERSINILYKGYSRSLGGREFDKVLFMHFASKIREEYNIDVFESSSACFRLGVACERLKIDLSKNNEASFSIEKFSGSVDVKGSITRKDFERLSISILEKIEEALKKALSDSGLNVAKIKLIEAIGKGCSIPAVIDILTKIFGNKKISKTYNYEHVAIRCALQAEDSQTDKHALEMTGLETSKLLSSEFNSEEEKAKDSEKFLWRRAMCKEGQLLTFLNDFLEENMHRIGRSEKTKDESYWLCKANYNLHKSRTVAVKKLKEGSSQVAEQFYQERKRYALQHELSEAQKLIEQLTSQRDVARKLSEAAQKVTEQLMSEQDDARKLSDEAQNLIEQLISERDDARKLLEAGQKFIEQLMSERDDARKLSEMAQKVTEQLMSERDDARNLSAAAHKVTEQVTIYARKQSEVVQKLIEERTSERDDARKLSEVAQNVTEQLMSERDDTRKLLEAAHKVTRELIFERDDSRKLSEVAQKVTKQLTCERDDARKHLEAAQKLIEQLMYERDDARKDVKELRRLTEQQASGCQCIGYFAEYNYSECQVATNNFHESFKLGEGGFGIVYRGILHNTIVAIKMMKEGTSQGAKEFNREVQILSKVRHPNLVKLIGACSDTRALIYEYQPNGSLEDRLQCNNNTFPLSWHARVRISFEICSAISFLHRVEPHGIVHGDLKPDNVLLDGNDTSKICDFGLCRELNYTASASIPYHWTDCPKGTFAYMDPEYLSTGKITPQFDVYSFGIILLRLATCKSPVGIRQLVEAAQKMGTLKALIDASAGPWPFKEAKKMISLGLRCSDPMRKNRPDLSTKVWKELKSMTDIASASMSF